MSPAPKPAAPRAVTGRLAKEAGASGAARRRPGAIAARLPWWRLAPALVAALVAIAYLAIDPRTGDLAAQSFRVELFAREGFTIWNGQWYAGHHTLPYSVLFPPLGWLLGPTLLGSLSAVVAAALFEPLARAHFGIRARWGALWFAAATGSLLFTSRLTFALGVAVGLGALLALQRGRPLAATALAVACSLASPVAGLFLALGGAACWLAGRRRAAGVAIAALTPLLALSAAFPEEGHHPFVTSSFVAVPLFVAACLLALPKTERALRIGALLYGLLAVAAFAVETPVGGTVVRLGQLFGGPVLACAILASRPSLRPRGGRSALPGAAVAAVLAALAYWQWSPPARDLANAAADPAVEASYYRPLLGFLERAGASTDRVEVPLTRSHWEAAEVAPEFALARGWLRSQDVADNGLFYEGRPTDRAYARWLAERAVRFVALPSTELDPSARAERELIERRPPYLALRWRSRDWRVYELTRPHPLATAEGRGDVRLAGLAPDELALDFDSPGSALVRVHWTPYWLLHGGCVEAAGEWTRVSAARPGRLRMTTAFSPERVFSRGRRCDEEGSTGAQAQLVERAAGRRTAQAKRRLPG